MIAFSSISCSLEGEQHSRSSTKRICREQSKKAGEEKTDETDSVLYSSLIAVCLRLADLIQRYWFPKVYQTFKQQRLYLT